MPAVDTAYTQVSASFTRVANAVQAARAQTGVGPVTYPLSGPVVDKSTPEWYTSPYTGTTNLDASLTVQATGDSAHRNPMI